MKTTEQQVFSVHPAIIFSLITKQAVGLSKALLELVMNAVDANSTLVDITIDQCGFCIADNGDGFKDKGAIESCFGVLGLPHVEGDAYYGRFRLGRMQSFAYAKTLWHTKNWLMHVDLNLDPSVQSHGYSIQTTDDYYQGCKIQGTFYQPLNSEYVANFNEALSDGYFNTAPSSDIAELFDPLATLAMMVYYLPIPVRINGVLIQNKDKSTFKGKAIDLYLKEIDYKVVSQSKEEYAINVFNKGVYAYTLYSPYYLGNIVTHEAIDLNMARNEAKSTCIVHKRIKNKLSQLHSEYENKYVHLDEDKVHPTLDIDTDKYQKITHDFWNRVLATNVKDGFSDLSHFLESFGTPWFQSPQDTTLSFFDCIKALSQGDSIRLSKNKITFYDRELFKEKDRIANSFFEPFSISALYIPLQMFPDTAYLTHLSGTYFFDLHLIPEFKDIAHLDNDKVRKSLSVDFHGSDTNEQKCLKLLLLLYRAWFFLKLVCDSFDDVTYQVLRQLPSLSSVLNNDRSSLQHQYGENVKRSLSLNADEEEIYDQFRAWYCSWNLWSSNQRRSSPVDQYPEFAKKVVDKEEACLCDALKQVEDLSPFFLKFNILSKTEVKARYGIFRQHCFLTLTPYQDKAFNLLKECIPSLLHSLDHKDIAQTLPRQLTLFLSDQLDANTFAVTDINTYIIINFDFFKDCLEQNKFKDLVAVLVHEICHCNEQQASSHGEIFYQTFYQLTQALIRQIADFERDLGKFVLLPSNFKTKENFDRVGLSQKNVEYFLKKHQKSLMGRF